MSQPSTREEARRAIGVIWCELRETYRRFEQTRGSLEPEVQEDLRKYVCIRMSGFLEQLTFLAISGYMREQLSGHAQNFYSSWFYRSPNLNPEQFSQLVARFEDPWKSEFKDFLGEGLRRETLKSLLDLRNDTAHGKSYRGSTLAHDTYMELVRDIYRWIAERWLRS